MRNRGLVVNCGSYRSLAAVFLVGCTAGYLLAHGLSASESLDEMVYEPVLAEEETLRRGRLGNGALAAASHTRSKLDTLEIEVQIRARYMDNTVIQRGCSFFCALLVYSFFV